MMKSLRFNTTVLLSCLAALLGGCGGGGGGGGGGNSTTGSNTPTASPEGVYVGTLTGSRYSTVQMLVLENGDTWAMYGQQSGGLFQVAGFTQGSSSSSNGSFTSSSMRDFGFNPAVAAPANATIASNGTVTGTLAYTAASVGFTVAALTNSPYSYNQAVGGALIAGNWSINFLDGDSVALNVSTGGTFAATTRAGCAINGTVVPRRSGKNVFDLSVSFGVAPCLLANKTATGVALVYPLDNGQFQLLIAAVDGTRTVGTAGVSVRTGFGN